MVDKMKFKSKMGNIIAISNGMPLVSAEVQAYYDGWEHGRKALIKELKAEILDYNIRQRVSGSESFLIGYCAGMDKSAEILDKYAGGE